MKTISIEITTTFGRLNKGMDQREATWDATTLAEALCERVLSPSASDVAKEIHRKVFLSHSFRLRLTTCLEENEHVICLHVWGYDKNGKQEVHHKQPYL